MAVKGAYKYNVINSKNLFETILNTEHKKKPEKYKNLTRLFKNELCRRLISKFIIF